MGRIVKTARVASDAYVVSIPEIEAPVVRGDALFADAAHASVPSSDSEGAFESLLRGPWPAAVPDVEYEPPSIDLAALRSDAEAIVDGAAADAQALLRNAQVYALDVMTQAEAQVARIEEDARGRGRDDGYRDGMAAADAQMREALETMREVIESARVERRGIIESAEPELVRLAMAVAERVVHSHIAIDANVVVENTRQALTRLIGRETVTIRVNPADLDIMREHRDAIVSSNDVEHLRIVEDQRVDRGGVVIETDAGTIDAKISTQLREARRAIVADGEIPPAQAS